jgi:hypothetical protein
MRFIKSTRHPFTDTSRKRAALARKQKAEREALPLFADEIAAGQKSPDDVMQARAESWARSEARTRKCARGSVEAGPPRNRRHAAQDAPEGARRVERRSLSRRSGLSAGFPA